MKKYFAHDIRWDTDGDIKLFKTLPQEIEIPDWVLEEYEDGCDDAISEYVSGVTGFCHYGFEIRTEKTKEEIIMANTNNIDRDNPMNSFTAFKYGVDIEDIVDEFSTFDINEAIAIAEADEYDEVVNDNTGEIVWKKGGNIMTNTNTSIYDIMVLGGTYHNDNGNDYIILAFDKDYDMAIFLNPNNNFTPYIGASGVRFGSWGSGNYFKTLDEVCTWFNKKTGNWEEKEDDEQRADICITTEFDNGTGQFYSYKKSALDTIEKVFDELLNTNPDVKINVSIDIEE